MKDDIEVPQNLQEIIIDYEGQILHYVLTDIRKLQEVFCDRQVGTDILFDKTIKKIVDLTINYYERYNSLLVQNEFREIIDKLLENGDLEERDHRVLLDTYENAVNLDLQEDQFNRIYNEWLQASTVPKCNEIIKAYNKKYLIDKTSGLDFIEKITSELRKINLTKKETNLIKIGDLAEDYEEQIKDVKDRRSEEKKTILTGIPKLDKVFNGFDPGTLTLIGAVTGGGKSTFALNISRNIHELYNKNVLVVSLEMSKEQWFRKYNSLDMYYKGFFVPYASVLRGDKEIITDGVLEEYAERLKERSENLLGRHSRYKVVEGRANRFSWNDIVNEWNRRLPAFKPDIIFVDHLSLFDLGSDADQIRVKLGNLSKDIRAYGQDHNIPMVVIVQANRSSVQRVKGKREIDIDFENIEGSNLVGQDADNFLALLAPELNKIKIKVAKQRDGGKHIVELKGAFDYCAVYDEDDSITSSYLSGDGTFVDGEDDDTGLDTGINDAMEEYIKSSLEDDLGILGASKDSTPETKEFQNLESVDQDDIESLISDETSKPDYEVDPKVQKLKEKLEDKDIKKIFSFSFKDKRLNSKMKQYLDYNNG